VSRKFGTFTAVMFQVEVFWIVMPCGVMVRYQHFRSMLPPSSSCRWRWHGPLKHWYPTTTLHSITTQKMTWKS